jgi:two-component system phosphate regulon sensor histidine kinase PhoR
VNTGVARRGIIAAGLGAAAGFAAAAIGDQAGASPGAWLLLALAAALIAGGAGFLVLRGTARGVGAVITAASRMAEGDFAGRISTAGGPGGDLRHVFNTTADRVERLFENVAAEHGRLEAVFDASTDGMVALARDTSVRFLNPAAVHIFGASMVEAIGRPFIESARDYELDALIRRAIAKPGTSETAIITFGPRRIPLRAAAVPIREGGDWAVLLMLTDLTEVQRVDQVRRDFLGNVSHELRTPLASIKALVETVEDDLDNEETLEFLVRIHQQVDRLTMLVNELLDLSRIESGAIDLRPEPVDLAALVAEAASLLRTRTEPERITIACPRTSITVEADRPSLLRVITNLLDNAIKYSPPGGTIYVETRDEGELVALSVRDEGPGIPDHDVARVFERFYKGEASRAGAGVGLGLAIVKHLVRAHGGTATAATVPGEGATFTVRLPKVFVGTRR